VSVPPIPDRDARAGRLSPASERNAGPILEVLRQVLPARGRLLEIASGSGYHAGLFAAALPGIDWQPSDLDADNLLSIEGWAAQSTGHIRPPIRLDAARAGWTKGLGPFDAVLLVNLLHLLPETGAEVLLAGLPDVLVPGGTACLYGPFLRDGQATSPGDAAFDASLRQQDMGLGYKDLAWVLGRLGEAELAVAVRDMPANNLMLVARRP
jgi:Protein of unknown function (DUF938)